MNDWITRLSALTPEKVYSQCGEESYLKFIFKNIGVTDKYFVDLGAGDARHLSNTRHLKESEQWNGLWIDADNQGNEEVIMQRITAGNILSILAKYSVPKKFDLLSIDLDGNDFYILNQILDHYEPRVVVAEFNPAFPYGVAKAIKYDAAHIWRGDDYYGASFSAFEILAKNFDYKIIFQNDSLNLYMVKGVELKDFPEDHKVEYSEQHPFPTSNKEWNTIHEINKIFSAFGHDHLLAEKILQLKNKFSVSTVIETGTLMGGTTVWLADVFKKVYTIEVNKDLYRKAKKRFKHQNHVKVIFGDSAEMIAGTMNEISPSGERVLFFLDAHWYENPLLGELKAIAESKWQPVIVFHDFKNPLDETMGYDIYPDQNIIYEFDYVKQSLDAIYGEDGYNVEYNAVAEGVRRGALIITPKKYEMRVEDTLNGGYGGLYGEVVTEDCYKLKSIKFEPDVIFDFGANVGVFSRYARSLFPKALIVAVEPNEDNWTQFKRFTNDNNLILINKAIGTENTRRLKGAVNGAHEAYISLDNGFEVISDDRILEKSPTIMPDELIKNYLRPGQKSILKIDIEGNELTIMQHDKSVEAMKEIDYIVMEIHLFIDYVPAQVLTEKFKLLEATHECSIIDRTYFCAIKK